MLEYGTCKLYTLSANKNEYKKLYRTISGDNKMTELDEELVNDTLTAEAIQSLSNEANIYLIHDPSDIRKPYSTKAEKLGKVRDLKNNIINGYSSYNIIAITPNSKSVHLISHESYSNKDPKFLKAELVHKVESDKLKEDQSYAQEIYDSDDWYNRKTLTKDRIKKVSVNTSASPNRVKNVCIICSSFLLITNYGDFLSSYLYFSFLGQYVNCSLFFIKISDISH